MLSWLMCTALLVDPRAGRGEISAGVSAEVRGGYAPVQAGDVERASVLTLLVPNIDLRYRHRRNGVLTFGYSPRMLYRVPNVLSVERPLFLHQLRLVYGVALNRRWDMFVGTNHSIGEIDYTAVTQVLAPMQGEVPDADVLNFAIGDGQVLFSGFLAPRHRLSIAPSVGYRKSLNDDQVVQASPGPGVPRTSFPDTVSGNLFLSYGYQLTRRDEIRVLTFNGVTGFDPGATYLTDDVRLGWVHQIDRRVTAEIDAGALSATRIQNDPDLTAAQQPERQRVQPVGSARIGGRLRSRAAYSLDGSIGANLTGYFDAVRGTLAPRAGGTITFTATLPPRWSIGYVGSVFTAATDEPLLIDRGPGMDPGYQIESAILNQVPVRYIINDNTQIEFGAILNLRMPHFLADDFSESQTEVWGYVAFRIAGGTARGRREVASRSVGGGQGAATGSGGGGAR